MKLSHREVVVALVAVFITLGAVSLTRPAAPKLESGVYDWEKIKVEPTDKGARRFFFQAPTDMLEELEMHVTTLNEGVASHAPHQHIDEEFILVKEGTVEESIDGKTYIAGPGSVIYLASNSLHGIRNVGKGQATYYAFRWRTSGKK